MTHLLPDSFQPRLGLASIELADESPTPLLPEDSELQPIDSAVERKLEQMLLAETFEKVMLDALRPKVRDSGILRHGIFHQLREQVLENLRRSAALQTEPTVLAELQAAIELLEHLGRVHELGEQYRYALLKG
jgi:hypothetical protein